MKFLLMTASLLACAAVNAAVIQLPGSSIKIQTVIDSSSSGDTLVVPAGTYVENLDFKGKNIVLASFFLITGDSAYISTTIIEGGSPVWPVVAFTNGENSSAAIIGFTIRKGRSDKGGGVYCYHSSPTIMNNVITENRANRLGGGIYCLHGNPKIINNIIEDNRAANVGGGVYLSSNSHPEISGNLIKGNIASSGGGISCLTSTANITGNIIIDNSAETGAGIYCLMSDPMVVNNVVVRNSAHDGGGIYCDISSPVILNTILRNNYAVEGPEVYADASSAPSITYCNVMGSWIGTGNIDSDPLFVGVYEEVFNVCAESPCIDAGDPGLVDPDGSRSDIGLYYPEHPDCYIGNVWHVSTSGNDTTGDGSAENPYQTIQHAIDNSIYGDTVLVESGSYEENLNFKGRNITLGSKFLITGDTSYISSTMIGRDSADFWSNRGAAVTFESLEENGAEVIGFTIHNENPGILCKGASPTIRDNVLTGNLTAMSCENSDAIIKRNFIHDNRGRAVRCWKSNPVITNNIIADNKFYWTWDDVVGGGIYCHNSDPLITNNTICFNQGGLWSGGIECYNSEAIIKNTIIWGNTATYGSEIYVSPYYAEHPTIKYCNIRGGWEGQGNIDDNPIFLAPEEGNFNVCSQSPCIDAGDPTMPDPDGSPADIGVYFYEHPDCIMGKIVHVSATGDDSLGDGSAVNPFRTIQHGVNISMPGDTVLVAAGAYAENVTVLATNILLASDFLFSEDSLDILNTVIEPDTTGAVMKIDFCDRHTRVSGFTIRNGTTGVECVGSELSISDNIIRDNVGYGDGAGISCRYNSKVKITRNVITGNSASGSANGGGIRCVNYCSAVISDNIITENYASSDGGGIYCYYHCDAAITGNTISNNNADSHGGGVYFADSCNLFLADNTITENEGWYAGGMFLTGCDVEAFNNIICGNSARHYAGIYCGHGTDLNLTGSTVSTNASDYSGGGIAFSHGISACLKNSIVWGNIASSDPEIVVSDNLPDSAVNITYSDIAGGWEGEGNIDVNPLFAGSDYNICSQSPCIDAGDPGTLDPDDTRSDMGYFFAEHAECQFGNVWHVSTTGDDLAGDGTEQNPFATIQHAADVSFNSDTIFVDTGIYCENVVVNGKNILLASPFAISGNPDDIVNTVIEPQPGSPVVTLVNCDSTTVVAGFTIRNGSGLYGGGVKCLNSDANLLSNIIVKNRANTNGGAIYCDNSDPTIVSCVISRNQCREGGAIGCSESSPTITNCILWDYTVPEIDTDGSAFPDVTYCDVRGGREGEGNIDADPLFVGTGYNICSQSACLDAGDPSITDPDGSRSDIGIYFGDYPYCNIGKASYVFVSGSDESGDGSEQNPFGTVQHAVDMSFSGDTVIVGNGMYVDSVLLDMKSILLASNFLLSGDTLDIRNTVIDADSARYAINLIGCDSTTAIIGLTVRNGSSFGILCDYADPLIGNSIITANCVGVNCTYSDATICYNAIEFNGSISSPGSGIRLFESSGTIFRNSIKGNLGRSGAGIYLSESDPSITQNVICENRSQMYGSGGGIYCSKSGGTLANNTVTGNLTQERGGGIYAAGIPGPTIANCILWGNDALLNPQIYIYSGDVNYCNIQGFSGGEGNIDINPLFAGPGYNVCANSPCIDAGDPDIIDPDGSRSDIGVSFNQHPECGDGKCLHVSVVGSDETGEGTLTNPFRTIQHAINNSFPSDSIIVGNGIYVENINFNSKNIHLTSNYMISSDSNDITNTVIDGDSSLSVVSITGCDRGTALTGFTVRNGFSDRGGGIYCSHSDAVISNNMITDNVTPKSGGGVYFSYSKAVLEHNVVNNNSAAAGGGIFGFKCGSSLIMNGNTVCLNAASSSGGGIYLSGASPAISTAVIVSNVARGSGGGILCSSDSDPLVSNCTISDNESGEGGGIFAGSHVSHNYTQPEFVNSIIWGNSADSGSQALGPLMARYSDIQGGWPGDGNIDADPLFCNTEEMNYHLAGNSPCLGAGEDGEDMGARGAGCTSTEIAAPDDSDILPASFRLAQNYPNPFNPVTNIEYALPEACRVRLDIYNILGRRVRSMVDQFQPAGWYSVSWNGTGENRRPLATGIYFYRIKAGDFIASRKMLLLK